MINIAKLKGSMVTVVEFQIKTSEMILILKGFELTKLNIFGFKVIR